MGEAGLKTQSDGGIADDDASHREPNRRHRGPVGTLLVPLTGLVALVGRFGRSAIGRPDVSALGHEVARGALGHEAAGAIASNASALGGQAAGAAAGAGAGAAAAGSSSSSAGTAAGAQSSLWLAGGLGATVVVAGAVVTVMGLSGGDPTPEPTVPTVPEVAAPIAPPPAPAPVVFVTEADELIGGSLVEGMEPVDGETITVTAVEGSPDDVGRALTLPSGATVTVEADGTFAYDPLEGFVALQEGESVPDRFTYTVVGAAGASEELTATVTVEGVNDPPEIEPVEPLSLDAGASSTVVVSATDPDSENLTFTLADGSPAFATLVPAGDGTATVTVASAASDAGTHEIALTVADDGTPPLTETVTVAVSIGEVALARVSEDLVALYDFDEGSGTMVADNSGAGDRVNLTIADPSAVTWTDRGLRIERATIIASPGPVTGVVSAARATNEITVEAWVTPALAAQIGPARVASVSSGTLTRNVTLGQGDVLPGAEGAGGAMDLWTGRVRSTSTSANGLPALISPPGSASTSLTHVVFTRSASGAVTLYVNGVVQASGTVEGDLSGWDDSFGLVLANETSLDRPWLGTYHLVAVYGDALTATEVEQNRRVGP